jgi:hypothetical protein
MRAGLRLEPMSVCRLHGQENGLRRTVMLPIAVMSEASTGSFSGRVSDGCRLFPRTGW